MSFQRPYNSAHYVPTLASMDSPSLNESDTDDSFMKQLIMHNRSRSENVLRPQPFSRAGVRPRNRLTLENLERLPIPEPPQVTTKSDLGSIGSQSSGERSRNKLDDIRRRELELFEDDEEDDKQELRRSHVIKDEPSVPAPTPPSPPPSPPLDRRSILLPARRTASDPTKAKSTDVTRSTARDVARKGSEELLRQQSRDTARAISREARKEKSVSISRERSHESSRVRSQEIAKDEQPEIKSHNIEKERPNEPARDDVPDAGPATSRTRQQQQTSGQDKAEELLPEQQTRPTRETSRKQPEVEDGSDLVRIRNMGNHLQSLSANLHDVRAGMDNISKMTGKPATTKPRDNEVLVRMSDREVFDAVLRAIWSSLWILRRDKNSLLGWRVGPGFFLLMLIAVPLYAVLECIACVIWCRPVFADGMEGFGTYPDAPELPYVIPTMLLRPLRPAWQPILSLLAPPLRWLVGFSDYISESSKSYVL